MEFVEIDTVLQAKPQAELLEVESYQFDSQQYLSYFASSNVDQLLS
jgi:hypothetical protein